MFFDWCLCTGRCAYHSDSQMFSSDALHIMYNEKLKNSDRYNRNFAEPHCVESTTGFRYPVFASFKGARFGNKRMNGMRDAKHDNRAYKIERKFGQGSGRGDWITLLGKLCLDSPAHRQDIRNGQEYIFLPIFSVTETNQGPDLQGG